MDQFRLPDAFKVQTTGNHLNLRVRCNLDAIKLPRLERPDIFANSHRIGLSCRCDLLAHSVGVRVLRNRCLNLSREAGIIAVRHAVFFLRVLPDTDECKATGNHFNLRVRCNLCIAKLPRNELPDIFAVVHIVRLSCRCDLLTYSVGVLVLRKRCPHLPVRHKCRVCACVVIRHAVFFLRALPDTDEGKAAFDHRNLCVGNNVNAVQFPRNELPDIFAVFHIVRHHGHTNRFAGRVSVRILRKRFPPLPVRLKCRVCACVVIGHGELVLRVLDDNVRPAVDGIRVAKLDVQRRNVLLEPLVVRVAGHIKILHIRVEMLDHICAERSGGVMVLSRLHLAVDHSVDVDVLRGVDVDVYIMLFQVWLMLAEGRAGRIASPVFDDGRIIGSGGRTVFFCLRDGLRLDGRKVDGIAVQTSDLIRIEVRVLAEVRRTVEIHFRNNGVLLAGVLHQNVRPAVDGVVLAELPLGRIVLIPLIMRMADLIQLDVLCCEVVQQVAAFASHTGEKLRLGGLVIVSDRFDDDLLIVIDHADDIRPAVDRDRLKTCGRVFGVRLVVVPLAVVVPAVEVVFAAVVRFVVVSNVERSQINDCTLRLLFERNRLEGLGHVAVAVDHNVDGLQVELPLRRQFGLLCDLGIKIERFCCVLFEPTEELVAFLGGCSRLVRGCIALDRLCVDRRHAFHVDVERYVVVGVNVSPGIGNNPLVLLPLHITPVVAFLTIGFRVKRLAALVVQADVDVYIVRIRLVGRVSRKRRFLQLRIQTVFAIIIDGIAIQALDASGDNHASGILGGLLAAIQEK